MFDGCGAPFVQQECLGTEPHWLRALVTPDEALIGAETSRIQKYFHPSLESKTLPCVCAVSYLLFPSKKGEFSPFRKKLGHLSTPEGLVKSASTKDHGP